jgi:hypothetical protein
MTLQASAALPRLEALRVQAARPRALLRTSVKMLCTFGPTDKSVSQPRPLGQTRPHVRFSDGHTVRAAPQFEHVASVKRCFLDSPVTKRESPPVINAPVAFPPLIPAFITTGLVETDPRVWHCAAASTEVPGDRWVS